MSRNRKTKLSKDYPACLYIAEIEKSDGDTLDEESKDFLKKYFEMETTSPGNRVFYKCVLMHSRNHWQFLIRLKIKKLLWNSLRNNHAPEKLMNHFLIILDLLLFEAMKNHLKNVTYVQSHTHYRNSFFMTKIIQLKNLLTAEKQ